MSMTVIIPSKCADNLEACVSAVRQYEPEARIIVIDDGVELTEPRSLYDFGDIEWWDGAKPFIYGRNCNIGIRAAMASLECSGVVLLNDDALLQTPGGFTAMANACEDYPEFGLIGATCNNVGNPNQHRRDIGLRDEPRMVCFVCVYIPRSTIDRVGLLDERYTGYGLDDDDYGFRVRAAGLKIGVHDGCYVDHGSLNSSYRGPAGAGGDFRGNMRIFIEKWGHDNWSQPKETSQFKELFP